MLFRSKEVHEVIETIDTMMGADQTKISAGLDRVFDATDGMDDANVVTVSPAVLSDLGLESGGPAWAAFQPTLLGGRHHLERIISQPTKDLDQLHARQRAAQWIRGRPEVHALITRLIRVEPSALWALSSPDMTAAGMPLMFPTWPVLSQINRSGLMLAAYHFYRGVVSPAMSIASPLSTILPPFWYLRKTGISFLFYLRMVFTILWQAMSMSKMAIKLGVILVYLFIYLYGVVSSIELANMVRRVRSAIWDKAAAVHNFLETAQRLIRMTPPDVLNAYSVSTTSSTTVPSLSVQSISDIYVLWTDVEKQRALIDVLRLVYSLDVAGTAARMLGTNACIATFAQTTRILGVRHPLLKAGQRNPVSLGRSLIITGPNAAGKSTYVKAIMFNVLLAQTLGVVTAISAQVQLWDSILSYMRVTDTTGVASLFEAEMERCSQVLSEAKGAAIVFLDEPMHSCPPTEGACAARAMVKHIAVRNHSARVVVTTHYHTLIDLEEECPDHFQNVSMEAIENKQHSSGFHFPYKLKRGGSYQCIALELLGALDQLPKYVIQDAIKYKNIICQSQ